MSRDKRLIDLAVDEAMEALAAIERVQRALEAILTDARVSAEERLQIRAMLAGCREAARRASAAAAKAEIADRVIDTQKRDHGVGRDLRREAEHAGLKIVYLDPEHPAPEAA